MSKRLALLTMMMLAALPVGDGPTKISSHKIEQKAVGEQPSKQQLQKMKGKKNRKNRGRNRK